MAPLFFNLSFTLKETNRREKKSQIAPNQRKINIISK
jgi:hypothetical protein